MKLTYKHTLFACYLGYITQAVVNNLPPLLFVTFSRQFHITLDKIAFLISVNFITQIITDLVATVTIKKTGYRAMGMIANVTSTIGLVFMATLPFVFENAFLGIIIASIFNAIGGGIMEVLVSPMVEALPGDAKASAMSLLHSFYCWGYVGVVLLSTLYFTTIGIDNWQYLPV
ncbi:MAG: MFS transporter, partial [Oscillospiraceae bacterium]|nr:MFS transporter [Oscillospiraceae bacterium]